MSATVKAIWAPVLALPVGCGLAAGTGQAVEIKADRRCAQCTVVHL